MKPRLVSRGSQIGKERGGMVEMLLLLSLPPHPHVIFLPDPAIFLFVCACGHNQELLSYVYENKNFCNFRL